MFSLRSVFARVWRAFIVRKMQRDLYIYKRRVWDASNANASVFRKVNRLFTTYSLSLLPRHAFALPVFPVSCFPPQTRHLRFHCSPQNERITFASLYRSDLMWSADFLWVSQVVHRTLHANVHLPCSAQSVQTIETIMQISKFSRSATERPAVPGANMDDTAPDA